MFPSLREASVDASSIIYMLKCGLLGKTASHIKLYCSPPVAAETGWPGLPVTQVMPKGRFSTNDESVVLLGEEMNIPVISEDKKLLMAAERKGLRYFNTLMILNWLLHISAIDEKEYGEYYRELLKTARYSREVLDYAEEIRKKIIRNNVAEQHKQCYP